MTRLLALLVFTVAACSGCARSPLLEQEIENSYAEAAALDTLHDYEVARLAAAAQLARVEGLIARERKDPELLALAVRGWCRYGFFFAWDDRELAEASSDSSAALYHGERALAGFQRAGFYAGELLEFLAPGYPRDKPKKLRAYLQATFSEPEQAPYLMWAGCAELGKGFAETDPGRRDDAREASRLLLEHALALDPTTGDGNAELMLAAVTALAGDQRAAADHLQRASRQSHEKLLLVDVARALLIDCTAKDERAFVERLGRVLAAGDLSPEHRLDNVVAKRHARRYLESPEWRSRCAR
ncbi:MAG TPA: TRAP transporter TatT component family protein [Polyangiaceae bacterium]|jgi:hypothetical protein|nr:TRAP transporter TatT component family protein [Polyangiaceae bacterium]